MIIREDLVVAAVVLVLVLALGEMEVKVVLQVKEIGIREI
jgi:hypothetical protein